MIKDFIPTTSLSLVKYSGTQVIERLGKEIISHVVTAILSGENLRNLTESLTQRRILLMNTGLLVTFLRAFSPQANGADDITRAIAQELSDAKKKGEQAKRLSNEERQFLLWFLGLTLKSVDNVTRGDKGLSEYLDELDKNLEGISKTIEQEFGHLDMDIVLAGSKYQLQWPSLIRCMLAIGAQTLTIRGSEKSMYGKLFEKFVLGSVISIMGGAYINKDDTTKDKMVFWLSDREDRRESDATFLLRPGVGISFDIGFIGKGNPEAAMDKLTRFDNMLQRGKRRNYMSTIVLIDTIGADSRAKAIAEETGGFLIQMSGTYWVKELAQKIHSVDETFDSPLLHMSDAQTLNYIKQTVSSIDLSQFLSRAELENL